MAQTRGDDPRSRPGGGLLGRPSPGSHSRARGAPAPAAAGLQPRLWGSRPGRLGVFVVIAGTLVGALITVLSGSEPGTALGVSLVIATAIATLAVAPRVAYLVIPAPALAYIVAAVVTGYLHDHATDTSRTALALGFVQWVAGGFIAMVIATALAVSVTFARQYWARRYGSGSWPTAPSAGEAGRGEAGRGEAGTGEAGTGEAEARDAEARDAEAREAGAAAGEPGPGYEPCRQDSR
jgi:hypothetical protein